LNNLKTKIDKSWIPNAVTLGNLLAGCISISFSAQHLFLPAVYLIYIGLLLDFLDGWVARWLGVQSVLGKELDSFSDLISFGLAPAFLIQEILWNSGSFQTGNFSWIPYTLWLIPIFSTIRLAQFNLGHFQSPKGFIGIPTPANALWISSLVWIRKDSVKLFQDLIFQPWMVLVLIFLSSLWLILPIPLLNLKFKNFSWKENEFRFIFLILIGILGGILWAMSLAIFWIPLILLLYLGISLIFYKTIQTHE